MKQSHAFSINLDKILKSFNGLHFHERSRVQQTVLSKGMRLCRCCYRTWPLPVNVVTFVVDDCRPFPTYSISTYLP